MKARYFRVRGIGVAIWPGVYEPNVISWCRFRDEFFQKNVYRLWIHTVLFEVTV